ncbi:alpha/beta hydrolase [Nocardiopsis ansamitocini]|uniref:Alpha/beta hydrolase n=1 Tax=Nocardiopsis ansamitocini TaxID=1670832 RepID=A0A9W6UJG5_9ACTN|nr:alpha/beta hydrolase [Nocardiopsis ansamitocini]GLU48035.1 alpha/beta hydrolase [Nocardiopsis ansamitocini]
MDAERGAGRPRPRVRTLLWRTAAAAVALLLVAALAFTWWACSPYRAEPAPLRAAEELSGVAVERLADAVVITPTAGNSDTGVVFYPGARVEPDAYVAAWAPITAATGVTVVLPELRLNLAVLDVNRADSAVTAAPEVATWYVGGHSLGGAMAASYLGGGSPGVDAAGLVLWGSYATEGAHLAGRTDLRVLSVGGGRDGLSTPEKVTANRANLPPGAETATIAGMNHAQFGAYGPQARDNTADISTALAHERLAEVTGDFLAAG